MKENIVCVYTASVTHLHLFAEESVRPRRVSVGKQLGEARFSLLLHSIAVGHSEQVDPVAIQGVAQQLSVVVQPAGFAESSDRQQAGPRGISGGKREGPNVIQFQVSPSRQGRSVELKQLDLFL